MSLSAFLAENAAAVENVKYVASKRFVDEEGQPEQWEIRALNGSADEKLRRDCVRNIPIPGRRGQFQRETDMDVYLGRLAVACTVYPNLNDAALQESYHVMGAEQLLKTMLTPGEYTDYVMKVQEVCGFNISLQEEVDEAKN